MIWEELRTKLSAHLTLDEMKRMDRAYTFAEAHHQGQKRLSGEPYLNHVVATAAILHQLHSDPDAIIAGLLHDCIEDTSATFEKIELEFGREVADLVNGVTKISTRVFRDSEEQKAENLRKIMLAMIRDIRVLVIKLSDRLHNMRTLQFLPEEKRQRLARETLEIYAPLAHRLGMARMKNELEDLAFRFLHPQDFSEIEIQAREYYSQHAQSIEDAKTQIEKLLQEMSIPVTVQGRLKHLFSIWNKMQFQKKTLDEIYDLLALRIIVAEVKDCYAALGVVHSHWKPIPGRFKDFIAMPRTNLYQSLHTTVIGPTAQPLEIQIRTTEMHRIAEEGIAAHWTYKENVGTNEAFASKLAWFRQFLDWQQDLGDSKEFLEALKVDLFEEEVFVFTPKGEVKSLRRHAISIDFAYCIHSHLGDTLIGSKVNGRLVPLKYELKNGDIVEIITRSDAKPSRDWLKIVKTTKAKNRIRHYFRQLEREEKIKHGRRVLAEELERCGTSLPEVLKKERLLEAAQKMNLRTVEELLLQLGDGNITARTVAAKLGLEAPVIQAHSHPPAAVASAKANAFSDGISVSGLSGMVIRFAQCCHPIPGDQIVGYITQGRGVSIHRRDCPNLEPLLAETSRAVQVAWDDMLGASHVLQLFIQAHMRLELRAELLKVFDDADAPIKETSTRTTRNNLFEGTFKIQIKGKEHLREIIKSLEKLKGVLKVARQ